MEQNALHKKAVVENSLLKWWDEMVKWNGGNPVYGLNFYCDNERKKFVKAIRVQVLDTIWEKPFYNQ